MAQQLAVLNEILKQNSSREQKILDETPLAIITAAAQQQQQDQAMAPQEEAQGMPEEQDPNEPQGMPEEQEMGNNTPQMMS
jgi:hypothetical protein